MCVTGVEPEQRRRDKTTGGGGEGGRSLIYSSERGEPTRSVTSISFMDHGKEKVDWEVGRVCIKPRRRFRNKKI